MITVFSLIKRRPKAHVRPSKNSKAMAPRAQDLMEVEKDKNAIKREMEFIWT